MATANIEIYSTIWTKVAEDTDDPVLIQGAAHFDYQVAAVATDTSPTVVGHLVSGRHELISREILGDGYIFVKLSSQGPQTLVVTK
jgi:hypothetical protein